MEAPEERIVQPPIQGIVREREHVGGPLSVPA